VAEAVVLVPPPPMVDLLFKLVHNILPLRGRLASMGVAAGGACPHCGQLEDVGHFFQRCGRVADLWDGLYARLGTLVPGLPSDWDFLMLAFPPFAGPVERLVVAHEGVLVLVLWEARSCIRPPSREGLRVACKAPFPALRPLF
jgi:hypothetical protein